LLQKGATPVAKVPLQILKSSKTDKPKQGSTQASSPASQKPEERRAIVTRIADPVKEKEEDELLMEISKSTVPKTSSEKPPLIVTKNEDGTSKEADEEEEEEDEDDIEQFLRQAMIAKKLMAVAEEQDKAKHKIHAVVPHSKKGTDTVEELDSDEEDEDDEDESGDFDVLSPK
jgi:hypothetical protein